MARNEETHPFFCLGCEEDCPLEQFIDILQPLVIEGTVDDWFSLCHKASDKKSYSGKTSFTFAGTEGNSSSPSMARQHLLERIDPVVQFDDEFCFDDFEHVHFQEREQ